jgi:hypothetical protein
LGNREGDLPNGINVRGSGGFTIAPYCVRPDGKGYRSVAGHPSLIASFQSSTIPIVPDWLIEIVRKARAPTGTQLPVEPITVPGLSSSRRTHAWALAALQYCITDLSRCPNGHRNNTLNAVAYRLGRIVARGWLDRRNVERQLHAAADTCGLISDDGVMAVTATIASGLNAGIKLPVPDLRERRR